MSLDKLAQYSILLSTIPALFWFFFPGKIILVTIFCSYPLVYGMLLLFLNSRKKKIEGSLYINIFIAYNVFILLRGVLGAVSLQDYITLMSLNIPLALFLPFTIYFGVFNSSLIIVLRTFVFYGLIFILILFFGPLNSGPYGFSHTIAPICLLILLIPYLKKKHALMIMMISAVSFFHDFSNRTNMLNIIVAICILTTFLLHKIRFVYASIKGFRILILTMPIVFTFLGVFGVFNIFKIGDFLPQISLTENKKDVDQDIFVDSRTSIYTDVFSQLKADNSIVFGLGGSGKTKTSLVDETNSDYDIIYKEGRRSTEAGLLNYIQWGGAVGGIIYFLLFVKASYLGVYKSNNWLCVMVGLWVAFKGLFSFIEDPLIFSVSSVFIFIPIGMCFNRQLRSMSNLKIRLFFRLFFRRKLI